MLLSSVLILIETICPKIWSKSRLKRAKSPLPVDVRRSKTSLLKLTNKIGRPRSGSPICLITNMITDRIGRHEVLLPINHNINKICDIIGYFLNQNTRNSKFCFASSEKKAI